MGLGLAWMGEKGVGREKEGRLIRTYCFCVVGRAAGWLLLPCRLAVVPARIQSNKKWQGPLIKGHLYAQERPADPMLATQSKCSVRQRTDHIRVWKTQWKPPPIPQRLMHNEASQYRRRLRRLACSPPFLPAGYGGGT